MCPTTFPARGPFPARRRAALWLGLMLAGAAVRVLAQATAEKPADAPLQITAFQQFWDLTAEQRSRPLPFSIDCDVTFADPAWSLLFVQDRQGTGAYVIYGANPFAFRSGAGPSRGEKEIGLPAASGNRAD